MNKFALISLLLTTMICAANAQIYQWTDSQGNVHFSDKPHPGAKTVDLPKTQTYSTPPSQKTTPSLDETPSVSEVQVLKPTYKAVQITQPHDQDTIRNNFGYIPISVRVEPKLFSGDKLQLILDGSPYGDPQTAFLFEVKGIYRGSHTLMIQVLDKKGDVVTSSDSITIYMHRPRVGMGSEGKVQRN